MSAAKFEKLSDDNYLAWSKWMRAYLVKQDVWGIVSGTDTRPTGSPNSAAVRKWTRKRDVAAAELLLHVSEKYISHCDDENPAGTWTRLQLLFCAQGQTTIAALRREFHSMMKQGEESMREWITRVDTLVYQLKELDSPLDDIDIINTLMRGIGNEYSPLIVQFETLLSNPDNPDSITIPYVIQRLISEEKRHKTTVFDDISARLSNVHLKNSTTRPRICFHCGEEGHIRNECNVTPRELYNRKKHPQGEKDGSAAEAKASMAQVEEGEFGNIEEISIL